MRITGAALAALTIQCTHDGIGKSILILVWLRQRLSDYLQALRHYVPFVDPDLHNARGGCGSAVRIVVAGPTAPTTWYTHDNVGKVFSYLPVVLQLLADCFQVHSLFADTFERLPSAISPMLCARLIVAP